MCACCAALCSDDTELLLLQGYTLNGSTYCNFATHLSVAECLKDCIVDSPPANGAMGNCPATMPQGSSCLPICPTGCKWLLLWLVLSQSV